MSNLLSSLFSTDGFMPHGHCYLWTPSLVWTMVTTDTLIGLAYLFISFKLYSLVRQIRLPFSMMFLAFGAFIAACGATHFIEVYTLWYPSYWFAALMKTATAIASVATAIYMISVRPKVFAIANAARATEAHRQALEEKTKELTESNALLQKQRDDLEQSAEKLKIIVAGVKDYAIFMLDPEGKVASWNEGALRIKGYEESEILGQHFSKFYPIEEIERGKPQWELEQASASGRVEDEGWRIRKDGSRFWANVVITAIRNADGKLIGFSKVTRDITERKIAQEKLVRANEELERRVAERTADLSQWESVFSKAGWGVSIASPDNTFLKVNSAFARMHGNLSPEAWVGRSLSDALSEESKAHLPEWIKNAHETGRASYESMHVREDGSTFPVSAEVTAIKDEAGRVLYRVAHFQDITEKNRQAQALEESEARFRTMANAIPQLAWMADPTGHLFWYNDRWYEYTGTTFEEMAGWGWEKVHDSEYLPKVIAKWKRALEAGEPWDDTFPLRGKDGAFRWFLSRALPIRNESGTIIRWFGSNTDITAEKLAIEDREQALKETKEALQLRDEFISIASHELKTPVTSVSLQLQMLARNLKKPSEDGMPIPPQAESGGLSVKKLTTNVLLCLKQTDKLTALLDELLDMTRIRLGRIELTFSTVSLPKLLVEVATRAEAQASIKQIQIASDIDPSIEGVWDSLRIDQVMTNLVSNAIKYGDHKPVSICAKRDPSRNSILIYVKDQGIGIAPEMQGKIFNRFERAGAATEITGLGLGLYITRQIVEAHGGQVRVESEIGKGSTFVVELPQDSSKRMAGLRQKEEQVFGKSGESSPQEAQKKMA